MTPHTQEIKVQPAMPNTAIAETYLEAIRTKYPSKALFAPEVTLQFPLSPRKLVGRETVVEYVPSLLPGIDDVKLERHMTGGEYVATLWEAQTVWGTVPICSVFRIAEGPVMPQR
jgi:hypothetical protein